MKKALLLLALLPSILFSQIDLSLGSTFHRMGVGGYLDQGFDYYKLAQSQIDYIEFSGVISNVGSVDLTNCFLQVEVFLGGSSVFLEESDYVDLSPGESDSVFLSTNYLPHPLGEYEFVYTAVSDGVDINPGDNSSSETFERTEYDFSRSNGDSLGLVEILDDTSVAIGFGNIYHASLDQSPDKICLSGVEIYIPNDSINIGHFLEVYACFLDTATGIWEMDEWLGEYIILGPDLGSYVQVGLLDGPGVEVEAGEVFTALIMYYFDEQTFSTSQEAPPYSTIEYKNFEFNVRPTGPAFQYDLLIDIPGHCYSSLETNRSMRFQLSNHPNPFNSITIISFQLPNSESVSLSITDIQGKEIYSEDLGLLLAGENNYQLFTEDWPEGVYLYTLSAGGLQETKRMVLIR